VAAIDALLARLEAALPGLEVRRPWVTGSSAKKRACELALSLFRPHDLQMPGHHGSPLLYLLDKQYDMMKLVMVGDR
jgi:hypothetical protein